MYKMKIKGSSLRFLKNLVNNGGPIPKEYENLNRFFSDFGNITSDNIEKKNLKKELW